MIPSSQQLSVPTTPRLLVSIDSVDECERDAIAAMEKEKWTTQPSFSTCRVWGIDFAAVTMDEALHQIDHWITVRVPRFLITANLNYAMLFEKNSQLRSATALADMVLCDGMPILWRSWINKERLPQRVAGSDLIYRLSEQAARRGHSIFFLGGAEGIASMAADRLKSLYPGLRVAGAFSPPFRSWTESDLNEMEQRIRNAKPDILLVAFGQPKGEIWISQHFRKIEVPISIQLGASFDFVAGTAKRAPKVWQRVGMEWLYRALNDPKRLVPRYASNLWFLLKTIRREIIETAD